MSTPLPPRFAAAASFTRPLYAGAGAALGLAGVLLGVHQLLGDDPVAPFAIYALLLAVVLYTSARTTRLRRDVRETEIRAEEPREDSGAERPADTVQEPPTTRARARLERFGREGIAIAFSVGGAAALGLGVLVFRAGLGVAPGGVLTGLVGLGLAVVAFLLQVASRASLAVPPGRLPESAGLGEWLRGGHGWPS